MTNFMSRQRCGVVYCELGKVPRYSIRSYVLWRCLAVDRNTSVKWCSGFHKFDVENEGGALAPGDLAGLTTITGDYLQAAGSLDIDIVAGASRGVTYDAVNVGGDVTLAGLLRPSLLGGFVPDAADAFTILSALSMSITGSFTNELPGNRIPTVDGLGTFLITYTAGDIMLSDFRVRADGDFDFDDDVDGDDFLAWQRSVGTVYDADDLADWRAHFGEGGSLTATSSVVPEGATLTLAALGLPILLTCNRRRPPVLYK